MTNKKKYDMIQLTCADCQHHSCNTNILSGCGSCSGMCIKTQRHIHCNRRARGCNFFQQVNWREVIGGKLCS